MSKKKRILIIVIILLCIISVSLFVLTQKNSTKITTPQTEKTSQQNFSANSPEGVTQAYYNLYSSCLKQHAQDLNSTDIVKDCPINKYAGLSPHFDPKNALSNLSYT